MYNRLMRKKDEEVIEKVVNKIIDSKVLLTGDGDFYVSDFKGVIYEIVIRNLFSKESSINEIHITLGETGYGFDANGAYCEKLRKSYNITMYKCVEHGKLMKLFFGDATEDYGKSSSFKRLAEYIEENKHLILHNDKEYGKSHTLTDADFI